MRRKSRGFQNGSVAVEQGSAILSTYTHRFIGQTARSYCFGTRLSKQELEDYQNSNRYNQLPSRSAYNISF